MWLVPHFMKRPAVAATTARLSLNPKSSKNRTKEGILTTYRQVANHLLETYVTDDVIDEADKDILRFTQPPNTPTLQFGDTRWMKTLQVLHVYGEYVLKETFIEELPTSIKHSMRAFWSSHKDIPLQKLAYGTTPLRTLQAATTEFDPRATRAPTYKNSGNRQPTHQGRNVINFDTPSCGQLAKAHIGKVEEIEAVYNTGTAISQGSAISVVEVIPLIVQTGDLQVWSG